MRYPTLLLLTAVATTAFQPSILPKRRRAIGHRRKQEGPQHDKHQARKESSTILFHRPLTAIGERETSVSITNEFLANVQVTSIAEETITSSDILNMPVFGDVSDAISDNSNLKEDAYPMAHLMQGSAGYIAEHTGKIAVFHISEDPPESVVRDISLCHILGLRIVLVISTTEPQHSNHGLAETATHLGVLRTEVERKLNRYLCTHHNHLGRANVVSGNSFVVARPYSPDSYHGKVVSVSDSKIHAILNSNDILILTNIVLDVFADHYIYTDGCQLASQVAVELQASKLILFHPNGAQLLLHENHSHVQDVSLHMAQRLLDHHHDEQTSHTFWHELQWAAHAVDHGVCRAHIVNANLDGALLEELFTAQNGANTCVYHDDELF